MKTETTVLWEFINHLQGLLLIEARDRGHELRTSWYLNQEILKLRSQVTSLEAEIKTLKAELTK